MLRKRAILIKVYNILAFILFVSLLTSTAWYIVTFKSLAVLKLIGAGHGANPR